ncbi:50S ribosomal protein L23 [Pseudoflavitalea sp. X16]|uniref:50S ribosomal protein L23 n=1 Tax=Paraflavitalea devenefica TaxID=2716334 RepID=UPI00141EB25B|nr:50S ribosomal protein L23 [Paraflavitalea devenefica]NII28312.1 50S ribosomal protein L23 [Paraflavitalea devenefica]
MKLAEVLIKPIVTEKSNKLSDKSRTYAFRVSRKANKLEIKKAVEGFYSVNVIDVNTVVVPGKAKSRFTKAGFISGVKPAYKKAYVTVAEGEAIDLYANI